MFRRISRIHRCRFVRCRLVKGNLEKHKPQQRLLSFLQPTTEQRRGMSENLETRDHRCLPQSRAGRTTSPKMADSCMLLLRMRRGNCGKGPLADRSRDVNFPTWCTRHVKSISPLNLAEIQGLTNFGDRRKRSKAKTDIR